MKDKVVLITGSSSGIGRETAYQFASAGAQLILTYNRNRKGGGETRKHCLELGAKDVLLLKLDVMSNSNILSVLERVRKKYGNLDILINNAGTGVVKPFKKNTTRDIEQQLHTNLEGLIKVTRAFLPYIKHTIINIGSFLSKNAVPDMAVYCASKFGVRGFTQALAQEHTRLRICCVNPDLTSTPLSGYHGRPPAKVAEVVFKVAAGKIKCKNGGDTDIWKIAGK